MRADVIGRLAGRRRDLLAVMQLLLKALLLDFAFARGRDGSLRSALLLQHAQLQLVLLLLALLLVALQIA